MAEVDRKGDPNVRPANPFSRIWGNIATLIDEPPTISQDEGFGFGEVFPAEWANWLYAHMTWAARSVLRINPDTPESGETHFKTEDPGGGASKLISFGVGGLTQAAVYLRQRLITDRIQAEDGANLQVRHAAGYKVRVADPAGNLGDLEADNVSANIAVISGHEIKEGSAPYGVLVPDAIRTRNGVVAMGAMEGGVANNFVGQQFNTSSSGNLSERVGPGEYVFYLDDSLIGIEGSPVAVSASSAGLLVSPVTPIYNWEYISGSLAIRVVTIDLSTNSPADAQYVGIIVWDMRTPVT